MMEMKNKLHEIGNYIEYTKRFSEINLEIYNKYNKKIKQELSKYNNRELQTIGTEILVLSFLLIRRLHSNPVDPFISVIMFHLADSVHNIPYRLNEELDSSSRLELIKYIAEFTEFCLTIRNIHNSNGHDCLSQYTGKFIDSYFKINSCLNKS